MTTQTHNTHCIANNNDNNLATNNVHVFAELLIAVHFFSSEYKSHFNVCIHVSLMSWSKPIFSFYAFGYSAILEKQSTLIEQGLCCHTLYGTWQFSAATIHARLDLNPIEHAGQFKTVISC